MKKKIVSVMLIFALVMSSFTFMIDDADAANKVWKEYNPDRYGDVTKTAALRSKSSSKSKSLGTIRKGTRVQIYGYDKYSSGSWYKAKYKNKIGYVYAKKVKLSYQAYSPEKVGVTTANMYIRSGVGTKYSKKKYIKKGSKLILHGYYRVVGPDWYKVSYEGKTGYVSSKYVKRDKKGLATTPVVNKMISTDSYVKVYWQKAQYASSYEIHRKVGTGKYSKIATVKNSVSSYVDYNIKVDNSYTYKIVAKKGNSSYASTARKVTPVKIAAPKLNSVMRSTKSNKEQVEFQWKAEAGQQYYVYRKTADSKWSKIATVNANSEVGTYVDKNVKSDTQYTYTCKVVKKVGEILYKYGSYDNGIKTLEGQPSVEINSNNLNATLTWTPINDVTKYKVYRRIGPRGTLREIGETTKTSFVDVYRDTVTTDAEKSYFCAGVFIDPSSNPFVYTVRGVKVSGDEESYSNCSNDGAFHIETPTIISVDVDGLNNARYEWATLKNAKEYYLYTGYYDYYGSFHWQRVAEVKAESSIRQVANVQVNPTHQYFTVKAKFEKDGQTLYSDYDRDFTIENRNYSNQNILYIGDSITYGSPYKAASTREVFSYPWRVQQLTGVNMYNPSIPGATYAYNERTDRDRMVTDVAEKIKDGVTPKKALHENTQKYKDFDVVVMAAGTNDYSDNTVFGDLDSKNIREFNGSVNQIMSWIKEGSDQRVAEGKKPIKVVFVEMFYSDRTKVYSQLTNRFETKNDIGLTLTDYQNNYNKLIEKYKNEGFDVYQFDTTQFVNQKNCPYVTSDNLHMSRYTYAKIGNEFAKYLIDNKIITKEETEPLLEVKPEGAEGDTSTSK